METSVDETLAIGILVAWILVPEMNPATSAIKTLEDKDVNWEDVRAMLIDKAKNRKMGLEIDQQQQHNTLLYVAKTNSIPTSVF